MNRDELKQELSQAEEKAKNLWQRIVDRVKSIWYSFKDAGK